MSLPIAYTPLTKLTAPWDGRAETACGNFEMDFLRCATRVGNVRAAFDCKKEMADFHECMKRTKQTERTRIMGLERKRQGRPGIEPLGKDIPRTGY